MTINKMEVVREYNKAHDTQYIYMASLLFNLYINRVMSTRDCAKELHCADGGLISFVTIRDWLKQYGIKLRKKGGNQRKTELITCRLSKLITANMTAVEIATEIKCSLSWVYILLKKNKIPFKRIPLGRKINEIQN